MLRANILSGEVEGNEIDVANEYLEVAKLISNKAQHLHAIPMYRKALKIQLEELTHHVWIEWLIALYGWKVYLEI